MCRPFTTDTYPHLQQHLVVNAGEAQLAIQKGQRHYDAQETAQGYMLVKNLD